MQSLVFWLIGFFSIFTQLLANPALTDSCQTIIWKSGKTMSIRIVNQTNTFIQYTKCNNNERTIYRAKIADIQRIDGKEPVFKSSQSDSGCVFLLLQSGSKLQIKVLEHNSKTIRYYRCDDVEKTEYVLPVTEVKSIDGMKISKPISSLVAHTDSCQMIQWVGGKQIQVIVVSVDSLHFKYYKCSDSKKRIYTSNLLDLKQNDTQSNARKDGVLSTLAILFASLGILFWPSAIAGLVLGFIAFVKKKSGKRRAIIAIIMSGVILLLVTIYYVLQFAHII